MSLPVIGKWIFGEKKKRPLMSHRINDVNTLLRGV